MLPSRDIAMVIVAVMVLVLVALLAQALFG